MFVVADGAVLTIVAFLLTCIVKSEYFGSEDNVMPILVKSEKKHFELLWLVASKLITGDRAIEDFIPGFTASKIDEIPAAFDAHLAGVVTSGRGRGWCGRGRRDGRGGCGGCDERCGGILNGEERRGAMTGEGERKRREI